VTPQDRPSAIATPLVPASRPPSAITTPLIKPSTPPSALATPPSAFATPPSALATPLVNPSSNPLRKQTLLGMAPVIPQRSEPPVPRASAPPAAASAPPVAAAPTLAAAANNPLRKQTLLGIAPVIPQRSEPPAAAANPAAAASAATSSETASSVSSIVTPALVATDAPTTLDVGMSEPKLATADQAKAAAGASTTPPTAPRTGAASRSAVSLSSSHDDLPALRAKRPRWVVPAGVAAALVLGVIGLRQLDRAPTPVPAELAHPHKPAAAKAVAGTVTPKSDEGDDDDDEPPSTGSDPTPDPSPPEPDPLKAAAAPVVTAVAAPSAVKLEAAPTGAAPSGAPPSAAAPATDPGAVVRINVDSDPPGARMFWKGKEVGTTPFVLELQPSEKHAYELGLPGYTTRKVVIDGSKTEITIGLRPDPNAPAGANPRK
jgi:hypothetical protein